MIEIYINQKKREDIDIMAGGTLEQTSEHATSSTLSVKVPVSTDDLKECDYIQLYDGGNIVYAGTILEKKQQTFVTYPDWRIYDLTITGASDLISMIFVDLTFPEGASIQQILFGNNPDMEDYDDTKPVFYGIFDMRIEPEEIKLGIIDDFSSFLLSDPAYLWGKYVSEVLDELCSIASAWWEITPDRVFNMRFTSSREVASIELDDNASIFDLSVSKDSLTYYSACRVLGGAGASRTITSLYASGSWENRDAMTVYQKDETTLVSETPLRSVQYIRQIENNGNPTTSDIPALIKVGYKGIDDDDPTCQALMSSGGTEITLKDGYRFLSLVPNSMYYKIILQQVVFEVDVYARIVDPELCDIISAQRGGTGIIEYTIEDDSIHDFGTAVLTAQNFLDMHSQSAVEIEFSTFMSFKVGQLLTVDAPYYAVFGNYQITKVVATIILDNADQAVFQYTVTASNINYRDPYKGLWYTPTTTKFTLEGDQPAEDGFYLLNRLNIKTYIIAYISTSTTWEDIEAKATTWEIFESIYPSWLMLQNSTNPYKWEDLENRFTSWRNWERDVESWAWLEQIEKGWYYLGNYLTDYGKKRLISFLAGENVIPSTNFFGPILLSDGADYEEYEPQDTSIVSNGGISTFSLLPTDASYIIKKIAIAEGNEDGQSHMLEADVDIDHREDGPRGPYSLTIAIRTTIE